MAKGSTTLTTRVRNEAAAEFRRRAKEDGITVSAWIAVLIRQALADR